MIETPAQSPLTRSPNPLLSPATGRSIAGLEKEMAGLPHLAIDLRAIRKDRKAAITDARKVL